jgi:pimeloyl-ACP methyl ester carboxylesterase
MAPASEAKNIAFDEVRGGKTVPLVSGFPTRRSWNRALPRRSAKFQTIAADLPGFGDSA